MQTLEDAWTSPHISMQGVCLISPPTPMPLPGLRQVRENKGTGSREPVLGGRTTHMSQAPSLQYVPYFLTELT